MDTGCGVETRSRAGSQGLGARGQVLVAGFVAEGEDAKEAAPISVR